MQSNRKIGQECNGNKFPSLSINHKVNLSTFDACKNGTNLTYNLHLNSQSSTYSTAAIFHPGENVPAADIGYDVPPT
jgi:hypothetical protein